MRVRTRRFQSGDQVAPVARCSIMTASQAPHASHPGLPPDPLTHSGSLRADAARWSGTSRPVQPFTRIETSGFFVSTGDSSPPARCPATMASADFPRHFLLGISPDKSMLLPGTTAAFTSTAGPRASLCCASSPRRVGLICGSCPSAHRFPLACLPLLGYLHRVGFT